MPINRLIPLPHSTVELRVCSFDVDVDDSDISRFVSVFLDLWNRIDAHHRECIQNHWATLRARHHPKMELQIPWTGNKDAMASTEARGGELKYCWKTCKLLPDDILQAVIAHEMGHVYQGAIGKFRDNITRNDLLGLIEVLALPLKENALIEIHADEMAMRWGFDPVLIDAYRLQYHDFRNGEDILRKKPRNEKRAYNAASIKWIFSRYQM
jgi:hypothetical protein